MGGTLLASLETSGLTQTANATMPICRQAHETRKICCEGRHSHLILGKHAP